MREWSLGKWHGRQFGKSGKMHLGGTHGRFQLAWLIVFSNHSEDREELLRAK
jgi:hypothetical protein